MKISSRYSLVLLAVTLLGGTSLLATEFKPITLRPDYRHDRFVTKPTDMVRQFEAFVTSFDGIADDNEALGIPDFVAYEIKKLTAPLDKGPKRPSPWITDATWAQQSLAPTDATYHHSAAFLLTHSDWYVRGHLCMKEHAWRLGANADWNTHTVLNAVPQRGSFNSGIWLSLENLTADWADRYGAVWIITGPILNGKQATKFLGEPAKGEMLIAIPDALFKIIIRDSRDPAHPERPEVLAFRFPQQHAKYSQRPFDITYFLTTVDAIEEATGLDFLTMLPDDIEAYVESHKATQLWQ